MSQNQNTILRKGLYLLLGIFSLQIQLLAAQSNTNFYVDPVNGNDHNNGLTYEKAFKTIQKAKNILKEKRLSGKNDVVVYLCGGTYNLESTLIFNPQDGGQNGNTITYKNYNNQKPILHGGKVIKGWKLFDKEKNIYYAKVGSSRFRQLYSNNVPCTRARTPNSETLKIIRWDSAHNHICVPKIPNSNWQNLTKVELVEKTPWTTHHFLLKSIVPDSTFDRVSVNPLNNFVFKLPWFFRGENFFFENAYEFIDTEGEWYLNANEQIVYYKPRSMEDISKSVITFPVLDPILTVEGASIEQPTSNLRFEGISFTHSTWLRPDTCGNIEVQATQYFLPETGVAPDTRWGRPSAGVLIKNSTNIVFERCTFSNMGATALDIISGASNIKIVGNVINDISGNGISIGLNYLGEIMDYAETSVQFREFICKDIDIQNNYITRVGKDYLGAVAIMYGYAQNVSITHNEIENVPYTGISAGWGWTPLKNPMQNNTISYNYIHDYMKELYDGGGIYVLSKQPNSLCIGNYVENMSISARGYGWSALYLDEGVRDFTVKNNVCEIQQDTHIQWLVMQVLGTGAKDCHIENNFTNSTSIQTNGNPVVSTHYYQKADWPQEAKTIIENAGLTPNYKFIKSHD